MGQTARLEWILNRGAARLAAAVVVMGAIAGGIAALAVANPSVSLTIALFVVSSAPIWVRLLQGRFDPFEPIQILALTFMLLYAFRPAAELAFDLNFFVEKNITPGFNAAAGIALVGMLSIYGGYALGAGRKVAARLRPLPSSWDAERSVRFAVGLLVVAGLLTAVFAASIGFGTFVRFYLGRTTTDFQTFLTVSGYFALGPYLTIPASFILLYAFARLRTFKVGALLAVTLAIALYITVPRGDRTYVLLLVLPILVAWYLRRERRPSAVAALAAVFAAILGMNILFAVRHVDKRDHNGGVLGTIATAITHPTSQLKDFITGVDLSEFSVLELEWLAYNAEGNGVEYHPGSTLVALAMYPVPRKLIGEAKPKAGGETVTHQLFPQTGPIKKRASFNGGMFGEQFADYGWVTLVLYSLITGIAIRALWEYFQRNSGSEGMQILFAATLPLLVIMVRNGEIDAISRALFQVGPLILCLLVCSRPAMRRMAGYRMHPGRGVQVAPEGDRPAPSPPAAA